MKHPAKKGFFLAVLLLFTLVPAGRAEIPGETDIALARRHLSPWGQELLLQRQGGGTSIQFSAIPVQGKITSLFGPRSIRKRGASRLHKGIDISAPRGTPVKAVAPGVIVFQGRDKAYGKTIVLDHGDNLITRYAHLDGYALGKGARVEAGQTIGTVGRTGRATGCNLHFETVIGGVPQDPLTPSLWLASLPKMETLPRLFAAKGRSGALPATQAPARVTRQQGSPALDSGARKDGRHSPTPLAGVKTVRQGRAAPPPRGDILP